MKLAVGCDHAGVDLKLEVIDRLRQAGIEVEDFGTHDSKSVDYPDVAKPVAEVVSRGDFDRGILICSPGDRLAMSATLASLVVLCVVAQPDRPGQNLADA